MSGLRWRFRESVRAEGQSPTSRGAAKAEVVARMLRLDHDEPYEALELFVRGGGYDPDRYVILQITDVEKLVAMLERALVVMRAEKARVDALPEDQR